MSLLVFPSFQVGAMNWTFPLKRTPEYATLTQTPVSGRGELRIPTRLFPRWNTEIDISYMLGDATGDGLYWQAFTDFYMRVLGSASDFLWDPLWDGNVYGQQIGTTDGTGTQTFLVYRTLVAGGAWDLIQNFQAAPTIKVGGSTLGSSNWAIDQYGTLSWKNGYVPSANQPVTWTGAFYERMHFLDDHLDDLQLELQAVWSCHTIKLRSVLL